MINYLKSNSLLFSLFVHLIRDDSKNQTTLTTIVTSSQSNISPPINRIKYMQHVFSRGFLPATRNIEPTIWIESLC
jgi:hypothetical protein